MRQSDQFIGFRICCLVIPTFEIGQPRVNERIHQSGSLANLARVCKRVARVCERGLRIAEHPQRPRSIGQGSDPDVLAKSGREGTMLGSLDTGDFFGEIALLTETPRSATVVTASRCACLVIIGPSFRRLLDETPSIQGKVLTALARRVAPSLG